MARSTDNRDLAAAFASSAWASTSGARRRPAKRCLQPRHLPHFSRLRSRARPSRCGLFSRHPNLILTFLGRRSGASLKGWQFVRAWRRRRDCGRRTHGDRRAPQASVFCRSSISSRIPLAPVPTFASLPWLYPRLNRQTFNVSRGQIRESNCEY